VVAFCTQGLEVGRVVGAAAGERHNMVYVVGGFAAVLATVMVACEDLLA